MVAHCHCQQKKRRIEDPSPGSEIPDTVPSDNLILLSEEEADIYHAELSPEENRRTVQQVLLEASAGLPSHIVRGAVAGVSGRYRATLLNAHPSRTSRWRYQKRHDELASRQKRNAAFEEDSSKKSLMPHFFPSNGQSNSMLSFDMDATQDLVHISDSEAESIVEDSEIEKIVHNFTPLSKSQAHSDPDQSGPAEFDGFPMPSSACGEVLKKFTTPSVEQAIDATHALLEILRETIDGKNLPIFTLSRLKHMLSLFRLYTLDPTVKGQWIVSSRLVASTAGKGGRYARRIRKWCQDFVMDHETLPRSGHNSRTTSILLSDEDLKQEIIAHLQSLGKYFSSDDLADFLNSPVMLERLGRDKRISKETAQRWLKILGYRWKKDSKGMYLDGHERKDVVEYRQEKFLPQYRELDRRAAQFDNDGNEVPLTVPLTSAEKEVIFHHHDESTFYGNDRRKLRWSHNSESPKPHAKGEGQSFMVADFVSSKLGWLGSPDGLTRARVTLRPGKARDGYFSCEEVIAQLDSAMDILDNHYASYQHVFVLDNARSHTKRADDAPSARRMPKNPQPNFGVNIMVKDSDGNIQYDQLGKPLMEKRRMKEATFPDGSPQSLYFDDNHSQYPGYFKGMTQILRERGYTTPERICAECKGFKCSSGAVNCCQRRKLFNQADFVNVPSLVESHCQDRGYSVLFLPKFHPELNLIEMCWGFAKRLYRELPPSLHWQDIEKNAIWSLNQIPLVTIRR